MAPAPSPSPAPNGTPAASQLGDSLARWFTPRIRQRLLAAVAASLVGPWLIGAFLKQFVQPGLHNDAVRGQLLIDFIVIGAIVFSLSLVLTWLIGSWITAVMKGPPMEADAFPVDAPRQRADEAAP